MKFCSLKYTTGACCIFATSLVHAVHAKEGPSSSTSMTNNASHDHLVDDRPASDDSKSSVLEKTLPRDNVEEPIAPHHPNRLLQGDTPWLLDFFNNGTSTNEWYGVTTAISKAGNRFVTGAYGYVPQGSGESLSGKVEVYDLINGSWTLVTEWFGADRDQFGRRVSISDDGKRIAATIPGANAVIVREETSPGLWTQVGERAFTPTSFSVALSGDGKRFVAGSSTSSHQRAALVYEEIASQWVQVGEIPGATLKESFAISGVGMSFDGKVFIAGAPYTGSNPNNMPGAGARVYEEDASTSGTWIQVGSDISSPGVTHNGRYGYCADISNDGKVVVLGEPGTGTIEIWELGLSDWQQVDSYTDSSAYYLGWSCAISQNGDVFVAGTRESNYGVVIGKKDSSSSWTTEKNIGPQSKGLAVSLSGDGDTVGIGSGDGNNFRIGKVAIYTRPPPCKDSELMLKLPTTGGSIIPFFCSQAARNKDFLTCGQILGTHCPYTCDKCDQYKCADSEAAEIVLDNLVSNCSFLKSMPPQRIEEICQNMPKVAETCRLTCKICE